MYYQIHDMTTRNLVGEFLSLAGVREEILRDIEWRGVAAVKADTCVLVYDAPDQETCARLEIDDLLE